MLKINQDTQESSSKYFNGGINENIIITSIVRENSRQDGSGIPVTAIYMQNKGGGTFKMLLWDVNEDKVKQDAVANPRTHQRDNEKLGFKKDTPVTPEDALAQEYFNYSSKLFDIMAIYLPKDQINIDADDYNQLCAKIVAAVSSKLASTEFKIKLVYKGKYLQLPRYGKFIEKQAVTPTGLKITSYDKVTKDQPDLITHPADTELPF